jgi:dihydroorotate dehydrogenase (fumarate)
MGTMADLDLSTTYLGLNLRNPLIVGANPMTATVDGVVKCARAGAGAVVMKSLFEEEIRADAQTVTDTLSAEGEWHSEVYEYLQADLGMRYGPRAYLETLADAKDAVDIPVIASINCVSTDVWPEFAAEVAAAGADALELNIAIFPDDVNQTGAEVEQRVIDIVAAASAAVDIPVAVKLANSYSAIPNLVLRIRQAGAKGCVLFNRLYRPTIHPETLKVVGGDRYSAPAESSLAVRWLALLSGCVDLDFAAATGFHGGTHMARAFLAGAKAVQMVTAIHRQGLEHIHVALYELERWMQRHDATNLADIRARVSQSRTPDAPLFTRLQYMKRLSGK